MQEIEYFYSAHSAYAYIGAEALMDICKRQGAKLIHRPIDLSPVVEAVGGMPFRGRTQGHVDYFFGRELERWAEWRGVEIIKFRPTWHDNPLDLPNGFLIAAAEQGADIDRLSFAVLRAHWRDDADIADKDTLAQIASGIGINPAPLLAASMSDQVQQLHQQNTKEAIERSLFGSPTYGVAGDMFYGQDRLEHV
ncbi:MAG: 2-hydroxychromene-2-carboxylate isomerase, partial [Arenibacterium sp.]